MVERHDGLHAVGEDGVDDVVVVVDALLVDGRAGDAKGHDAGPGDAEAVRLDAQGGHARNVLLVEVVVGGGDVGWAGAFGARVVALHRGLPGRGPAALVPDGALDLQRGAGEAPGDVFGEAQAAALARIEGQGWRLDQLVARDRRRLDGGADGPGHDADVRPQGREGGSAELGVVIRGRGVHRPGCGGAVRREARQAGKGLGVGGHGRRDRTGAGVLDLPAGRPLVATTLGGGRDDDAEDVSVLGTSNVKTREG